MASPSPLSHKQESGPATSNPRLASRAWLLFALLGVGFVFTGLALIFVGVPLESNTLHSIAGSSWPQLQHTSPGAARFLTRSYQVWGLYTITLGFLVFCLAVIPLRRGENWSRLALASIPLLSLVLLFIDHADGGLVWPLFGLITLLSALALLLARPS